MYVDSTEVLCSVLLSVRIISAQVRYTARTYDLGLWVKAITPPVDVDICKYSTYTTRQTCSLFKQAQWMLRVRRSEISQCLCMMATNIDSTDAEPTTRSSGGASLTVARTMPTFHVWWSVKCRLIVMRSTFPRSAKTAALKREKSNFWRCAETYCA